jgi:ParB family chromosome partitioning protein
MKELSLLRDPGKMSLNPSGKIELSRLVNIEEIKTQKEFEELFPIVPTNQEKIRKRMEVRGYDNSQPLHIWEREGKPVLIDGHHRLRAARENGITEIPCYFHRFEDLEEALEYAISVQVERRNLSDAELLLMMKVVDELKVRGKGANGEKGKSAKRTAEILGTNTSKIEKARIVKKYGSEELKGKVASGELTLNQAYLEARMAREDHERDREAEENNSDQEEAGETETETETETNCHEGEETVENDGEPEYDIEPTISFLKAAVLMLNEHKETKAVTLLVNHFVAEKERAAFYARFPEGVLEEEGEDGRR